MVVECLGKVAQSCLTLRPNGLYSPWNSPGQSTGVSSCSLLQGIFSTQGSNPGLLHCRQIPYQLSLELTPQKDVFFLIGDWNAKVESQEIPGVTDKFGFGVQNEKGQRLIEFSQENALVITNTLFQQHKRKLYTWTSPDGQYRNQIDYILCNQIRRTSL